MSSLKIYYKIPQKYETAIVKNIKYCFINFLKQYNVFQIQSNDHVFSCVKISVMILSCLITKNINPAQIYHFIRVQSYMKVYVLSNFLELCDKLVATMISDILLYIKPEEKNNIKDVKRYILGGILYLLLTLLHSLIQYVNLITLHVCANLQTTVLYALLITNNFAELRAAITKKYEQKAILLLFKMDLEKRFQSLIYLCLIYIYNYHENCDLKITFLIYPIIIIWFSKICVENIKHVFIARYNSITDIDYYHCEKENNTDNIALNVVVFSVFFHIVKVKTMTMFLCLIIPFLSN
ncbi:hypothetical protein EDEG_00325 [Edhazardia aedis USNM 41457]|uniref:Uncharacterized protein n=1 Tax=Edhazardia aedis (strain USNM 41457) TaxID=1003232 RepID=J9D332_EDHAE|nr:hypothetical protein EDEG_00325 [Edhazardia aedis USNM 41457]|eukprot:EJW01979.1 hypothetical protein EDEG_00325 [Edhazardia aedis USNM 41457]